MSPVMARERGPCEIYGRQEAGEERVGSGTPKETTSKHCIILCTSLFCTYFSQIRVNCYGWGRGKLGPQPPPHPTCQPPAIKYQIYTLLTSLLFPTSLPFFLGCSKGAKTKLHPVNNLTRFIEGKGYCSLVIQK